MSTKLYRSRTDAVIGGVCGGLGRYLGVDSTLVRLFFILLGLSEAGVAVLIYGVLWLALPLEGRQERATIEQNVRHGAQEMAGRAYRLGSEFTYGGRGPNRQAAIAVGIALIVLGLVFLAQNLDIAWLRWLRLDLLWPILLIIGGLALLFRRATEA